ncbi:deleted in malignant brain tumors 1 protein-like [Dreissena polymorpha]|uniref:deleted in malignant brain tumors 1 protein-like n=1 Tax=Dreissena polymorpha TaxID=45954 RepID=UPI0022646837|nr:deleted in malignant brain tumors 1 protein-like [Dreissena polymorpha]
MSILKAHPLMVTLFGVISVILLKHIADGLHIRLVNGSRPSQGRLEVFYNNTWGTVCDDDFNSSEAKVVCRMLGFTGVLVPLSSTTYGQGTGPIWLDDVRCIGTESSLSYCRTRGWGEHNCGHHEDVGVDCYSDLKIRLVNGLRPSQGRVEIFYNNTWGTICDDNFDNLAAKVVCRMLGFPGSLLAAVAFGSATYGKGTGPIWLAYVTCKGTESSLSFCQALDWGNNYCSHYEDVGVDCGLNFRLVNGSSHTQGRLEVFFNNTWGTICDDYFDSLAAKVVCRMLGFTGNLLPPVALSSDYYGQGTGPIWLDDVRCNGTESSLSNCRANNWGVHNCQHRDDVGVDCSPSVSIIGNQPVNENSSLRLLCQLSTCFSSRCNYFWTSSIAINGDTSQQDIMLTNIKRDWNSATIYCRVTVNGSFFRGSTTIKVQYAPDVTLTWDERAKIFTCTAAGNPDNYTFHALEHRISGSLIRNISFQSGTDGSRNAALQKLSYQDNGTYKCAVENGIRKNGAIQQSQLLDLVIKDVPILLAYTKAYSVSKGDPLNLTIPVYAFPAVPRTGIVIKIGNRIMSTSENITVNLEKGTGSVSFHNKNIASEIQTLSVVINAMHEDYFGHWSVNFNNDFGKTTAYFSLNVYKPDATAQHVGMTVGSVIGGLAGVVLIVLIVCFVRKKTRNKKPP